MISRIQGIRSLLIGSVLHKISPQDLPNKVKQKCTDIQLTYQQPCAAKHFLLNLCKACAINQLSTLSLIQSFYFIKAILPLVNIRAKYFVYFAMFIIISHVYWRSIHHYLPTSFICKHLAKRTGVKGQNYPVQRLHPIIGILCPLPSKSRVVQLS